MIIPWMGFSLSELLNKVKIKPEAKYVKFISVYDPEQMIGQRRAVLNWPYVEGLRLDEAMHPLTTVVTGLYGKHFQIKMVHHSEYLFHGSMDLRVEKLL
jgi:sulfoxide reductase catalytic subunit YedY